MSKVQDILNIVAEIMEVDTVAVDTPLDSSNWDSLAIVSFISDIDGEFDQILNAAEVGKVATVGELVALVK